MVRNGGGKARPEGLNQPEQFLTTPGTSSEASVDACEAAGIEPLIAVQCDQHHSHYSERFSELPELPTNPTPAQRMAHWLKNGAGKAAYTLSKSTVEPVVGIIVSMMGMRQLLTRGLDQVQGVWHGI